MEDSKLKDVFLGKECAEKVLKDQFLETPPIVTYSLIGEYGLSLCSASFEDPTISGWLDINQRRIVLNQEESIYRQNFTLAHELGHWLMHKEKVKKNSSLAILYRKPLGCETDPLEIQANAFAAYLLVPDFLLKKNWNKSDLQLMKVFGVSQSVIGFRRKNFSSERKNYE